MEFVGWGRSGLVRAVTGPARFAHPVGVADRTWWRATGVRADRPHHADLPV
ncbi:MAG TPA: hypothetical protein VFJ97_04350 [Dermatophilaceae bacterium]|nr:hypothetical protein [Dermatophilaceae bacterium]